MALVWPCKRGGYPVGDPLGEMSLDFCQHELGLSPNTFFLGDLRIRPQFAGQKTGPDPLYPYSGARCIVIQLTADEAYAAARPGWKSGFYVPDISPETAAERIKVEQNRRKTN